MNHPPQPAFEFRSQTTAWQIEVFIIFCSGIIKNGPNRAVFDLNHSDENRLQGTYCCIIPFTAAIGSPLGALALAMI